MFDELRSDNGKWIAYGSSDCSVGLLDAFTLAVRMSPVAFPVCLAHSIPQPLLKILKSHEFPPTVLKFNPTSRLLISGSADNTVRLIAIPEGLGDSCAYYSHLIIYWFELTVGPLSLSASWSYTLMIVLALFVVLFALTVQLFMRGAI